MTKDAPDNLAVTNTSSDTPSSKASGAGTAKIGDIVLHRPTNPVPATSDPYPAIVSALPHPDRPGVVSLTVLAPVKSTYTVALSEYDESGEKAGSWKHKD